MRLQKNCDEVVPKLDEVQSMILQRIEFGNKKMAKLKSEVVITMEV